MKQSLTLSIILIVLCSFYLLCNIKIDKFTSVKNTRFKYVKPKIAKTLYFMMNTIDEIFTKHKIKYWIDGGTYLGAIRHTGIIPWDDDIDLEIMDENYENVIQLKKELSIHGLELMKTWFGFKIFPKNGKPIKGYPWKYPAADIFVMKKEGNKINFKFKKAQNAFGKCHFKTNEINSIKRLKFGANNVNAVSKIHSDKYLSRCYGKDWSTHAYQTYDHMNEKTIKKIKIVLTDDEKQPAKPFY